jgi:hypothetical protein
MESVPSMSGPKRKAGSPLRETEVLTDDNHLGLVTVEIVAGDEGSKVNVKVQRTFQIKLTQSGLWSGNLSGKSGSNIENINEYFWMWNGISDITYYY